MLGALTLPASASLRLNRGQPVVRLGAPQRLCAALPRIARVGGRWTATVALCASGRAVAERKGTALARRGNPQPVAAEIVASDETKAPRLADSVGVSTAGAAFAAAFLSLMCASPSVAADVMGGVTGLQETPGFQEGVVSGFLLILFSELGDKTFFIAVLLSLQQPKTAVFAGTFGALAVMTVISVGLGSILHIADESLKVPFLEGVPWDDYLAVALLVFFGVKTLVDANEPKGEEEEADAKEAVENMGDLKGVSGLIASTFALVFAAEWGDKSFIATIALAAASSPTGVITGALGGHAAATGLAVSVGGILGQYVSEKVVGYVGGSLFLVFAAITVAEIAAGGK